MLESCQIEDLADNIIDRLYQGAVELLSIYLYIPVKSYFLVISIIYSVLYLIYLLTNLNLLTIKSLSNHLQVQQKTYLDKTEFLNELRDDCIRDSIMYLLSIFVLCNVV